MAVLYNEDSDNPFRLPADDEIFQIREEERQRRAEERERVKGLRVWEKTTASSRVNYRSRRAPHSAREPMTNTEAGRKGKTPRGHFEGLGEREIRREKENIADFVAKKREMFMVQMSLDVKKAEILKLDERGKHKEEALIKSEQILNEDNDRFDTFLISNDDKAHRALQNAEVMTKKKQEAMQKIKQLKSKLSALQTEIAKHREQKEECMKYKAFLEKLTPQEWKDLKAEEKRKRKHKRKMDKVEARIVEDRAKMQAEIEAEERLLDEKNQEAQKSRRRHRREAEEEQKEREKELETRKRRIRKKYKNREEIEAEISDYSSGEEMDLFFKEPKQLLEVFTSLEESNLFLIQNSQDTEQTLEELQQKFAETKRAGEANSDKVKHAIALLEKQIADEQLVCEELRLKLRHKDSASEQGDVLQDLSNKTIEVHMACGYEAEHDPDTLVMLGAIEAKLEEFLTYFEEVELTPEGKASLSLKEKDREMTRRREAKARKKEQQTKKTMERVQASRQRSEAPIHRKTGKQIMIRSPPLVQARRVVLEDDGFEESLHEHEVFGIWMSKEGIPNASMPVKQQ
mmetsp:Transcript_30133/g.65119  ORF Transcript_30133/g.65119 Transcript_30133/m.65119 type:complete len:573 (+) Transcript_30133:176-1894(+)|eukprot:CAMPEP_0206448688 /NCGR_PEP_ID=MMETSP0324_2-20121206/17625_1 /ASSEMBLY_ACC=CAM_ASM_000836 /TAXON_ID=2866 /ORGANISM="Crypthecodinium cohnii, Strain Seligo" /LENGTH=572 /DNA_ID=CAMNT_0053917887 /DNA_START=99 /DNA_END=1817 /DNA_ORIENTATION=-